MDFLALLEQAQEKTLSVPADWGQGRTVFGGLSAALLYEAMRAQVSDARPLRSIAVSFIGPLALAQPFRLEATVLREGRAVSQVQAQALQEGVQVVALASFGHARASQISVTAAPAPSFLPWQECPARVFCQDSMPAFAQHVDIRWAQGEPPGSNSRSRRLGGWVRFREGGRGALTAAHLLALVDAWPPATLSHLPQRVPSSSLTWTLELVAPLPALTVADWCAYEACIEYAEDGYGHIAARLYSEAGQLLALSRQVVTVFG